VGATALWALRARGRVGARDVLRLARLQTSGVTACAPLYGYLAAAHAGGESMELALQDTARVALMIAMGVGAHIFGFVHNEIADRVVDARGAYRRPKPLASGAVGLGAAATVALLGLGLGMAAAAELSLRQDFSVLALALISAALAAAYNLKGKAAVGGDAILAASIAFFVMAGGAAATGFEGALATSTLEVALLGGLILFFNNAFEGGFKDHASDRAGGKRTLVLALRARGEKFDSPDGLVYFAHIPFHGLMLLVALALIFGPMAAGEGLWNLGRAVAALALAILMTRAYGRGIAVPERKQMLSYFSAHEGEALLLLLIIFLPEVGWPAFVALLFGPLLVFVGTNRAVHGTFAAPDV
jgi:4-hydroxybenzoate polyprenyltransferase